jgi:hypothetical protein
MKSKEGKELKKGAQFGAGLLKRFFLRVVRTHGATATLSNHSERVLVSYATELKCRLYFIFQV